jgi:C4-dicarboxylate-specific signal transduction histidine kinase
VRRRALLLLLGLLGGWPSASAFSQTITGDTRPVVLVLVPVQPGRPMFDLLARGVLAELTRSQDRSYAVYTEYLYDLADPPELAQQQEEFIRAKYGDRRIDAIIGFGHPGYLLIRETLGLPARTPLVYVSQDPQPMLPATAQLTVPADAADSYAFVARLLPTPHDVALIGGSSDNDRALNARIRERLRPLATVRSVTDLTQHTLADLRDRVAALPAGTVIVVGAGQADREGRPLSASILLDTIRPVARGPVVVTNDITIGQGALGGLIYRVEDVGAQAARLVETILQGAPPESLGRGVVASTPTLDASLLARFGIDPGRVPRGTRLINAQPSRWQASRPWVLGGLSALALQTALIFGLVAERRRRRESEERLAARVRQQALVADVSTDVANLPDGDLEPQIAAGLAHVGSVLAVAECALWAIDVPSHPTLITRWRLEPGTPGASMLDDALLSWAAPMLLHGEVVHVDDVSEVLEVSMPPTVARGTAALLMPLRVDGRIMAILSVRHDGTRASSERMGDDLRTVGEMMATAVVRKRTDASIRQQLDVLAHVDRVAGLGELAASLSHELNQPLTAILSHAESALTLLARPAPPLEDVRGILAEVIADNERASGIIRHMRAMLKRQRVEARRVDVNAVVTEMLRLVDHDTRLRGSSLDVQLQPALPPVRIDPTQLKQVLLNLVVNATDAMASRTSREAVELRTLTRDGGVMIEVRDHGPGIPDEALQRLFDPLYTTKAEGLGVGLATTRSIVEAARGLITAQNVPAGGAVFRVWLPSSPGED